MISPIPVHLYVAELNRSIMSYFTCRNKDAETRKGLFFTFYLYIFLGKHIFL